jgi:Na+/H+-dicarboxylate symporter
MKKAPLLSQSQTFSLILIASIAAGSCAGLLFGKEAAVFKPAGDIFLNLLFTAAVPLVFFSIASALAGMADLGKLGKILSLMLLIFVATGVVSSLLMLVAVKFYPPGLGVQVALASAEEPAKTDLAKQMVQAFTVSDFSELLSRKNMLALILFSGLFGLAVSRAGEKGRPLAQLLAAGAEVMLTLISFVMLYAPLGLAAYFAYIVGVLGPDLFGSYLRAVALYYPMSIFYFFAGFSLYAYLAAGASGVKAFWSHIVPPSLTAFGTGSSIATIPSNLQAADRIGIPREVSEIVIPVGATIHMDGTCMSAILKIALAFGLLGRDFSGTETLLAAVGIALLSGVVMSGIPGGGFLGEIFIVTCYGFPAEILPMISMIGTLVDPPATMVNAVGDNVASMMIARLVRGKNWRKLR